MPILAVIRFWRPSIHYSPVTGFPDQLLDLSLWLLLFKCERKLANPNPRCMPVMSLYHRTCHSESTITFLQLIFDGVHPDVVIFSSDTAVIWWWVSVRACVAASTLGISQFWYRPVKSSWILHSGWPSSAKKKVTVLHQSTVQSWTCCCIVKYFAYTCL